jgi:hypothetical protein
MAHRIIKDKYQMLDTLTTLFIQQINTVSNLRDYYAR